VLRPRERRGDWPELDKCVEGRTNRRLTWKYAKTIRKVTRDRKDTVESPIATSLRSSPACAAGLVGVVGGLSAFVDALLTEDAVDEELDVVGIDLEGNTMLPTSNPTKNIDK
jgi:hypothetical protein